MSVPLLSRLFALLLLSSAALSALADAGAFQFVVGDVRIVHADGRQMIAVKGARILEGDTVVTGADGQAQLLMADQALISLRPDSSLRFDAYRFAGKEDGSEKGILGLIKGGFRTLTGLIGRANRQNYQVRTPNATIGVRGTDHEPLVIPAGSTEGEPGSYDRVNVGSSYIRTQHGSVDVKPNQAGFAPLRGRPVPRVLPQVPAFFKATRHEAAIAARHEVVRKAIDQRRDDRRKVLQEKKTQLDKQKAERQKAVQERKREQDAQRLKQREERNRQLQDNRQRRQQESGLQQRNERERRSADAGDRRQRLDERRQARPQDREMRDRDRPRRNADGNHAPRGGGRGRD